MKPLPDMIVTGDGDVPLYLKVDSGNVDDKSVFVERLKEFKKQWTFSGIYVIDCSRRADSGGRN